MATWEDGPEYAPLERPNGFSLPDTPPLENIPPEPPASGAPQERPRFADPGAAAVPLASLVPVEKEQRDPQRAFEVVTSTLTSMDSAWGAAHWSDPGAAHWSDPGAHAAVPPWVAPQQPGGPPAAGWEPPVTPPWSPAHPYAAGAPAAPLPPGYPTPGTPQWLSPGPPNGQPPGPDVVDARRVFQAATPGLCITLAIGGFVSVLAPVTFCVALALSSRVRTAKVKVRATFFLALAVIGLFALLGVFSTLLNAGTFGDWWTFVGGWTLVVSWVTLIVVLWHVRRELKYGRRAPVYPTSSPWG